MKNITKHLSILALLSIAVCPLSSSQTWSGVVDPTRATDWTQAGVSGGIPIRPTHCATLSAGATSAAINSAISSCPSGQTVFLNAGTYNVTGGIDFSNKANVTVEGAGADQTLFVMGSSADVSCGGLFANWCLRSIDTSFSGGPSNTANWTAGYSKGTTVITLDSHTNLKVGSVLTLDENGDSDPTGLIKYTCDFSASNCSLEGNGGNGNRAGRPQFQQVTVTACGTSTFQAACSSNSITIDPPIIADNYVSGKSPGAWWATNPAYGSGIKNLSIDGTADSAKLVGIFNCSNCFLSGLRFIIGTGRSDVEVWNSSRITVRDSYFYGGQGASQSYGIAPYGSSFLLFENNILQHVTGPQIVQGCSGCVLGYNYSIWSFYTASSGFLNVHWMMHTAGDDLILLDGNQGAQLYGDVFHGSHNLVTGFRNYMIGNQPTCADGSGNPTPCTSQQVPVILQSFNRAFNLIGNVLGQTGTHLSYQNGSKPIYDLGSGNSESGKPTVSADAVVISSLFRWGNCDAVTGFGACKFDSTEVPTGLSTYSNAIPASHTLPSSFYLSGRPSWWAASIPFPATGPDVSGGNVSNVGGHVNKIPAWVCADLMGIPADGTGSVKSFNADTCYTSSPGTIPPAPSPVSFTMLNGSVGISGRIGK